MRSNMAASQQKKRPSSSNVLRISLPDEIRLKNPKKQKSSEIHLNTRNEELVGIRWRDMAPFLDHIPRIKSCLANVVSVPHELYSLTNLRDMFSYEVWKNFLSEDERHFLAQFLPSGCDVNHAVKSLFSEENLHFGNPFSTWVDSLCSGHLHPEKIQHKELQLITRRNAYFADLKAYHLGFIENIKKLEKNWEGFRDPDREVEDKILRKKENSRVSSGVGQTERDLLNGNSKFMAYVKITKKQHQMIMNVRNSDDGIHPKSLNKILGDIRSLSVKSYAKLEEEERERTHVHWLKLANEDIPNEFKNRRRCKVLRNNLKESMHCELKSKEIEKKELKVRKERENLAWMAHREEPENKIPELTFAHEQPQNNEHVHSSHHLFADCQGLNLERIMQQTASPSDVSVADPSVNGHMSPPAWKFLGSADHTTSSPLQEAQTDRREAIYGDSAMQRSVPLEHLSRLGPSELRLSLANSAQYEEFIGLDHRLLNRNGDLSAGYMPGNSQESSNPMIGGFSEPAWLPQPGVSGSADGSLFCVLSECNKLLSGFRQTSSGSEQFPPGGIYLNPVLDSSGGRDGAGVWRNYPNQRPGLS